MTTGDPPQQKTSQGNEKKKEDENITQGDPPQRERSQKIGIKKKFKKMTQAFFLSLDVEVEYGDARQSSNRLARVLKVRITCDDDEERSSLKASRGYSRSSTCQVCSTCYCEGCIKCRFEDCNCQECRDFMLYAKP
ncbi:Protein ULTRAPETALA 2 [Glycine max]|nr:Protein ULTRAPETALA 2 [Glycine max]KAH1247504.1 Protein ULTRAPETALA 2 [Glycine max]